MVSVRLPMPLGSQARLSSPWPPMPLSLLCSTRKLIGISFGDLNPFPLRQIRNRGAYHLEKVRLG